MTQKSNPWRPEHLLWVALGLSLMYAPVLLGANCADDAIIRDRVAYETELNFMEKASMDQADLLAAWIKASCTCEGGKFSTTQCEESAATVVAIRARIPWHKALSRYNAGLDEKRPEEMPPEIPDAQTLCPETN
jgi:hypothetical protein